LILANIDYSVNDDDLFGAENFRCKYLRIMFLQTKC